MEEALIRLQQIVNTVPTRLMDIAEEDMTLKLSAEKWSKKEILGHLIDSATNNHQRFVRGQFEHHPAISYDQNNWNKHSFYQEIDSQQIISFWTSYNKQIIEIIKRIHPESLTNEVKIGDKVFTLDFLIIDYVNHLEHHLKQIFD